MFSRWEGGDAEGGDPTGYEKIGQDNRMNGMKGMTRMNEKKERGEVNRRLRTLKRS